MSSRSLVADLERVVNRERVLSSPEDLLCYSYDASPSSSNLPQAVVFPASTQEMSQLLGLCYRLGVPVVPRGAGTGLSGASLPAPGKSVVVCLTGMNRILHVDATNLVTVVEPGVTTGAIHQAVEAQGLFYPPDPSSAGACTIGGNVATGAGGLRALKYGVTRHYVLGLEVVLPDGEVMTTGATTAKNATGYDLTRLMVGSEGTLAVFTRITLHLIPLPLAKKTLLAAFRTPAQAAATVSAIVSHRLLPSTLEFMDGTTLRCVDAHTRTGTPTGAEAVLLIEADGTPDSAAQEAEQLASLCREYGAMEVRVAETPQQAEHLTLARRSVLPALAHAHPQQGLGTQPVLFLEDATVPPSRLVEMVEAVAEIGARFSILAGVMGHAGDGNLHPYFIAGSREEKDISRLEHAVTEMVQTALELGGTVSGEHGIGVSKAAFLPLKISPTEMRVMRFIKDGLDPKGLLNPGKLFPSTRNVATG
ncbi:MAG: FAD-linked oxidase C-terminal domain-containing protein [Dehalococcoidia bacterium]|nr:FAD-linked oxidase C-terminal domain-containing protein [Dehalococcoidia bacterium]